VHAKSIHALTAFFSWWHFDLIIFNLHHQPKIALAHLEKNEEGYKNERFMNSCLSDLRSPSIRDE